MICMRIRLNYLLTTIYDSHILLLLLEQKFEMILATSWILPGALQSDFAETAFQLSATFSVLKFFLLVVLFTSMDVYSPVMTFIFFLPNSVTNIHISNNEHTFWFTDNQKEFFADNWNINNKIAVLWPLHNST